MSRLTLFFAWLCAIALVVAANPAQAAGSNIFSYVLASCPRATQ